MTGNGRGLAEITEALRATRIYLNCMATRGANFLVVSLIFVLIFVVGTVYKLRGYVLLFWVDALKASRFW